MKKSKIHKRKSSSFTSKVTLRRVALFIFVFLLAAPLFGSQETRRISRKTNFSHTSGKLGEYHALIIGINDYKDETISDLKTAVKDAEAVGKMLKERYGFHEVTVLKNRKATRSAIDKAFRNKIRRLDSSDSFLIYFAGHGDIDRLTGDGWWVPSDAKSGDSTTYIENSTVQKYLRAMKARHVLVVSDSCYSGTLFGETRALPARIEDQFYLDLYNERSRWGMTSGNKTPVSDRGFGGHSVFAYQLIKTLEKNRKPYLTPRRIYEAIGPIIRNNSEHMPQCRPIKMTGDMGGEFVFILAEYDIITNALGMKFKYIKPGSFMMGSPAEEPGRNEDENRHRVTLTRGFYIQTTEVTQDQWQAVMETNPSWNRNCGGDCPVERVSWNDAQDFIRKLNRRENRKRYRLPTEAEWEYAARSGSKGRFFWGDNADCSKANYGNSFFGKECKSSNPGETMKVASFSSNKWGLYDMHGNVHEWCRDWYGDYSVASVVDPIGPSSGSNRVSRGGSWSSVAGNCRSADRDGYEPGDSLGVWIGSLGFRLVLSEGD